MGGDPKKAAKFMRKSFSWTGPSHKLDYCWYRQEWRAVGPAEGDIGPMPPPPPCRDEERLALPPRMLLTHSGFGGQRGLSQKQEFGFGNRGSCSGAAVSVASNCEAVFSLSLQVADVCFLFPIFCPAWPRHSASDASPFFGGWTW